MIHAPLGCLHAAPLGTVWAGKPLTFHSNTQTAAVFLELWELNLRGLAEAVIGPRPAPFITVPSTIPKVRSLEA